jgi:hypothetical protein
MSLAMRIPPNWSSTASGNHPLATALVTFHRPGAAVPLAAAGHMAARRPATPDAVRVEHFAVLVVVIAGFFAVLITGEYPPAASGFPGRRRPLQRARAGLHRSAHR